MQKTLFALLVAALAVQAATASENDMLMWHNQERARHGLSPLRLDDTLSQAAGAHAHRMAAAGAIAHSPTLNDSGSHWRARGENVGTGYSLPYVFELFMTSDTHRALVLDSDFDAAGIGIAERDGDFYVCVRFGGGAPSRRTRLDPPAPAAPATGGPAATAAPASPPLTVTVLLALIRLDQPFAESMQ